MDITYNIVEIDSIAETILNQAHCKTLLFVGEMGAGKTTLIKALAKKLGVTDITQSPTYGFVNVYETPDGQVINHFDFYRLKNDEEAYDIGLDEYFYNDNWNFVEWPDKAISVLPNQRILITLEKVNTNIRKLILEEINVRSAYK